MSNVFIASIVPLSFLLFSAITCQLECDIKEYKIIIDTLYTYFMIRILEMFSLLITSQRYFFWCQKIYLK